MAKLIDRIKRYRKLFVWIYIGSVLVLCVSGAIKPDSLIEFVIVVVAIGIILTVPTREIARRLIIPWRRAHSR